MDGFGEIGVFVRVVEARSFTRAAHAQGITASGVSRIVARLEARLGVRLLERTTRSIGLTVDGAQYYERCIGILRELEDANSAFASARAAPRGRLRVDAPTALLEAAVQGFGLAAFLEVHASDAIRARKLEVVLPDHEMPGRPIHALYTRDKARLPKVRVFLSFLEEILRAPG